MRIMVNSHRQFGNFGNFGNRSLIISDSVDSLGWMNFIT